MFTTHELLRVVVRCPVPNLRPSNMQLVRLLAMTTQLCLVLYCESLEWVLLFLLSIWALLVLLLCGKKWV